MLKIDGEADMNVSTSRLSVGICECRGNEPSQHYKLTRGQPKATQNARKWASQTLDDSFLQRMSRFDSEYEVDHHKQMWVERVL